MLPVLQGWLVATFAGVIVVYLAGAHRAFGKRRDGSLHPLAWLAWWPFLGLARIAHELERALRRGPPSHQVAPGLYVGRRPRVDELPDGVVLIVDLCAELGASPGVRRDRYVAYPTLDARPPAELAAIVATIGDARGPVLVHCASGVGRSATVAAAVLIARGLAADVDRAEAILRARRPGVRLTRSQRRAVAAMNE